jgi:23S rRNA (guanosine2251-2'-O)-methyltransferase
MEKIWIYGKHAVTAALANPKRKIHQILATNQAKQDLEAYIPPKISIKIVNSKDISNLVGQDAIHQNIAAQVFPLSQPDLEDIYNNNNISCLLILDHITDPHNVGAIMRSAAAFEVDAIIATHDHSPKESATLAKSASGALETIPLVKVTNLASTIKALKKQGYWIIGLDINGTPLNKINMPTKAAFILGAEGTGMRRLTKENCDLIATIQMSKNVESLNVSNAAAITLYQFYSQIKI